jgi:hypothetical protein
VSNGVKVKLLASYTNLQGRINKNIRTLRMKTQKHGFNARYTYIHQSAVRIFLPSENSTGPIQIRIKLTTSGHL